MANGKRKDKEKKGKDDDTECCVLSWNIKCLKKL